MIIKHDEKVEVHRRCQNAQKQDEKLAQALAWEICSAGQCGQNRRCLRGIPFHVHFGKGGDSENLPFTGAANTCTPKYFEI